MERMYITVPKHHQLFTDYHGINRSALAREKLDQIMAGSTSGLDDRSRRHGDEMKRTSVTLSQEYIEFINQTGMSLSHLIQDGIQELIDRKRALNDAEDNSERRFNARFARQQRIVAFEKEWRGP